MNTPITRLAVFVVLLFAAAVPPSSAQNPSRPLTMRIVDFSWPLQTGAVVPAGATAVTLDRGMGFLIRFRLPADCAALTEAGNTYGADGSPAFRLQFDEARAFCGQARVFTLGTPTATRDFVSRYNFTALPLEQLPFEVHCLEHASSELRDLCGRIRARDNAACTSGALPAQVSLARFLVQIDSATKRATLDCRPLGADPVSCRLAHAQFAGVLTARGGVVHCTAMTGAAALPGVELQDVTFRDVNRDGVMDAILSLRETGAAAGPPDSWFTFALSRRSATAQLERIALE